MKKMSKRWLSLFLTLTMLVVALPLSGLNVSALWASKTPATLKSTVSQHKLFSTTWDFKQDTVEEYAIMDFSGAPAGAYITFDYDATNMTSNPYAVYGDQHVFAFYIDYQTKTGWSETETPHGTKSDYSYNNNQVLREYTKGGETFAEAKNDAVAEPGVWCFSVPLGSKGTFSFRLYNTDANGGGVVETNTIKWLRIRQERWIMKDGEANDQTVCKISNIGYAVQTTTPPTGYQKATDNGFYYTASSTNASPNVDFFGSVTQNAAAGSRLAIYFDTTAIDTVKADGGAAGSYDINCFVSDGLSVWDTSAGWVDIKDLIGGEAGYQTNMTTVFTREEDGKQVTRTVVGKDYNYSWYNTSEAVQRKGTWTNSASGWLFTLPSDAKGWVIFTFTDPTKIRTLTGYMMQASAHYADSTVGKRVYLGNAGIIPPTSVLAATEGVYLEQWKKDDGSWHDNYYNVRVDKCSVNAETGVPDKQIKAGSLKVYDINGNVIGVPRRYGYQSMVEESFNNTFEYEMMVDQSQTNFACRLPADPQDVVVKAEYVDTATLQTPNFAYIGWQQNTAKGGIRSVYRFNLKREGWYHWDIDYYTYFQGEKKVVDAFGILMCTEKVYNEKIGGAEGMVTTCANTSLYNTNFYDKLRRWDACLDYEDASFAMVGLNTDARKSVPIYTRGYIVVDGVTYYTDIQYCSYDLSVKGTVENTATAITH